MAHVISQQSSTRTPPPTATGRTRNLPDLEGGEIAAGARAGSGDGGGTTGGCSGGRPRQDRHRETEPSDACVTAVPHQQQRGESVAGDMLTPELSRREGNAGTLLGNELAPTLKK
jgi:hypothetical protein